MKMSLFPAIRIPRVRLHGLRRVSQNEDGVSALEFALIAPFLLLLYFGGVEVSLLMLADRQVTSTSATMGDLTSRLLTISDSDSDNIFSAAETLLSAINPADAALRVSSLQNVGGTVTVVWSDANANTAALTPGSAVTDLPADIVPDGGTIIMTETQFSYVSEIGFFLKAPLQLEDRFFLRPRRTESIARVP